MPKAKKGPRQSVGLKCGVCGFFNYLTQYNKNNELLKKQKGAGTFPLRKYCKRCRQHTEHKPMKKLK